MERSQLVEQLEELNYILGKISRYRKQNQYVYPRPFASWQDDYNRIVTRLKEEGILSAPVFALKGDDMSPSGKSVGVDAVERLVKTIVSQVGRLEETLEALDRAAGERPTVPPALQGYFPRGEDGEVLVPPLEERVCVVVRSGGDGQRLLQEGIVPVLRTQAIPWASFDRIPVDEENFAELVRELYASRVVALDLAEPSPQVMFALGMACALARQVLLLRPAGTQAEGETLPGFRLEYANTDHLRAALGEMLRAARKTLNCNPSDQEVAS